MTAPFPDVRAILFDWDGTLLNSFRAGAAAYLAMFDALGIPWNLEDLGRHYSPDWQKIYRAAQLPRALWQRADRIWRLHYARQQCNLVPGARQVLDALAARFTVGLVTSGHGSRVLRELRRHKLTYLFRVRIYAESTRLHKPDPAPLQLALRNLQVAPESSVYVGDAPEDIRMARRAGVRSVAVLGPFTTRTRLRAARPDALIERITRLPHLFYR
ncbi:MAG: HAD family hydrolase [Candidatus Acidiferrales bacterium]